MSAVATTRTSAPLGDPAVAARLLPPVAAVLAGSAFERRSRWSQAVDDPDIALAGFVVLDLAKALHVRRSA